MFSVLLARNSQLLNIDLFLSIVRKFVELPLLKRELLALAKSWLLAISFDWSLFDVKGF